jgi:hypothetical protein
MQAKRVGLLLCLNALCFSGSVGAVELLVGNYSGSSIQAYSLTGGDLGTFVSAGSGGLSNPGGFAIGPDGNLYVASRGTDSILEYNGSNGDFLQVFATLSTEGTPLDIEFGSNGDAYVAAFNGFYILGSNGTVLQSITTGAVSAGGTFLPSNGNYLLSETSLNQIVEYTLSGNLVATYSTGYAGNVGLVAGPDGRIYAANQNNGTVGVAPVAGGAESTFASGLSAPEYLASYGGNLYVTDYDATKVDVVNGSGTIVSSFSTPFSPYGIALFTVPEPSPLLLISMGCLLLGYRLRKV